MAIVVENSRSWYQTSDISTSFDSSGGNYMVAMGLTVASGFPNVPTYDGSNFTQQLAFSAEINNAGAIGVFRIWTLESPSSGSNTFALDRTDEDPEMFVYLYSLSGIGLDDPVEGTDSDNEFNVSSSGHDPIINLSITQSEERDCFVALMGTVWQATGSGTNNHQPDEDGNWSEDFDSTPVPNASDAGKYVTHRIFTDGSGAKTVDGLPNNYSGASERTHAEIAIMINEPHQPFSGGQIISFDP